MNLSGRERQNLAQALAGGDADLALHQIDAGHHFRDRMLHLNARVDFDEVQVAVGVHQEFDGARIGVANGFERHPQRFRYALAQAPRVTATDGDSSISFW